jgi:hydrogenase maturation protease
MTGPHDVVVIGIGNEFRRDDGAGPAAIERLRGRVPAGVRLVISDGEPADLVEAWAGADLAIVVDAMHGSSAPPGGLYRVTAGRGDIGGQADRGPSASSHGLGLGTAVALARALGQLPGTLIIHAVEGADFGHGPGLSDAVGAAIDALAAAVLADLRRKLT